MADGDLLPTTRDDAIDALVLGIHALQTDSLLQFLLAVGRLVTDSLFGGDPAGWRGHEQDVSFRRLCEHPGLELTVTGLSRAVRVYELDAALRAEGLTEGLAALRTLSPSHFYAVLGLPREAQTRLLRQAETEGWTTRALEGEARRARVDEPAPARRGGRPRVPRFQRTLRRLGDLLAQDEAFGDLDAAAALEAAERAALLATLRALRCRLDVVADALGGDDSGS